MVIIYSLNILYYIYTVDRVYTIYKQYIYLYIYIVYTVYTYTHTVYIFYKLTNERGHIVTSEDFRFIYSSYLVIFSMTGYKTHFNDDRGERN